MSLRYEIPDDDPEQHRKWAKERNAEWELLAFEAMKSDTSFSRWRRTHWSVVWFLTIAVFGAFLGMAISYRDSSHFSPRAFGAPFVAASIVVGIGSWLYSKKIRAIGVAEWSRRREKDRTSKNA